MTAVELFKELENQFQVTVNYQVGLDKELSEDVLEVIKYLKGDLLTEDLFPSYPTSLSLVITKPADGNTPAIKEVFYQDSKTYMEVFDKDELTRFMEKHLLLAKSTSTN